MKEQLIRAALLLNFLFGIAEISARNALFTCSEDLKSFATSGSIITIKGSSFMRSTKRLGSAFL
jgi:hypothetical protein